MNQASSPKVSKRIKHLPGIQRYRARILSAVSIIAVAGALYILTTSAATDTRILEAEDATLLGLAQRTSDNAASGSAAVRFGTAQGGTPNPQPSPPPTSGLKDGTFTGNNVSHRFGEVQVSVVISGGKITAVNFDTLYGVDSHSDSLNSSASPQLVSRTIAAQSAAIDGVSGVTYTSDSYKSSLQSALDKAKV